MSRWHNIDGFADLPLGAFQAEQVGLTTRLKLHGGGGGGPNQTTGTTTSYQSNLPEYAKPYFEEMMARTGEESRQPFTAYTGDRVSPFSTMQQQAQTEVGGMQAPGDISTSRGILGAVGAEAAAAKYDPNLFGSGYTAKPITSGYQAGALTSPDFTPAQAAKYMSPYQQQVIDIEKREAIRRGDQERLGISAAAQQAGAFGGARHGVVEAEQKRNLAQQLGDIQTVGSQQAYDRAAGQFGADRAAQMQAASGTEGFEQAEAAGITGAQAQTEAARQQQAALGLEAQEKMEQSKQFSAQFKQQARDQQLKVSDAGAKLGDMEQRLNIARTQLQNAVGAEQQAQKQKDMDKAFDDFVNARDYERQQLAFYNSMLRGVPTPVQREVRQMTPAPSGMAQMTGMGISGLAAMNAFGGGK
jgi:hypothetical protein